MSTDKDFIGLCKNTRYWNGKPLYQMDYGPTRTNDIATAYKPQMDCTNKKCPLIIRNPDDVEKISRRRIPEKNSVVTNNNFGFDDRRVSNYPTFIPLNQSSNIAAKNELFNPFFPHPKDSVVEPSNIDTTKNFHPSKGSFYGYQTNINAEGDLQNRVEPLSNCFKDTRNGDNGECIKYQNIHNKGWNISTSKKLR